MTRRSPLLALLLLLPLAPGCSRQPARDLPPTLVWLKDQGLIRPADGTLNAWAGIRLGPDLFVAEGEAAQFILWRRRRATAPVFVEYSLQGRPAELAVNGRGKWKLRPSPSFRREKFDLPLAAGCNFLRFGKRARDPLQIRSIAVGRADREPGPHLGRGEGFSVYLPAGSGRLELLGRGRVRIVEQTLAAVPPAPTVRELTAGFFSRKISHAIALSRPATIRVASLDGDFMIGSLSFQETAPPAAPPRERFQGRPDITIILADGCQAAHLGVYGYGRNTSPHIDAFAADAMVYENAYANASFTRSSVATLLTGLYPDSHNVRVLQHELPKRLLTLPEYLSAKGYRTGIISSSSVISPHFGLDQGVDDFINVRGLKFRGSNPNLVGRFVGWLGRTGAPRFGYVHFLSPHLPTVPPPGFALPFAAAEKVPPYARMIELSNEGREAPRPLSADELRELVLGYDASIAWMDREFGRIIARLKQGGLYDESLIIFLADHGEALNEHGVISHGSNVYDEAARVPLIVKYPKSLARRGRSVPVCQLADIFPTISGLFGQELPMDGRSLLARRTQHAFDDALAVCRSFSAAGLYGLRWQDWYAIIGTRDIRGELFQLSVDPRRDVSRRFPQAAEYFLARFLSWFGRFRNPRESPSALNLKSLTPDEIREMKTLGYL